MTKRLGLIGSLISGSSPVNTTSSCFDPYCLPVLRRVASIAGGELVLAGGIQLVVPIEKTGLVLAVCTHCLPAYHPDASMLESEPVRGGGVQLADPSLKPELLLAGCIHLAVSKLEVELEIAEHMSLAVPISMLVLVHAGCRWLAAFFE